MSYTLAYKGAEIDDILARAVPGGAIDQALATKQDALTFDAVPTEGSTNPAESGGIYDAIQAGGATALAAFATDSVSGDVVSITDGASNIPVKAFTGSIIPQQNLNGQASPYPAGGGANKWDEQWELGSISQETGQNSSASNTIRAKNICACSPSTTYYLGTNVAAIYWYGTGGSYISFDYNNASGNVRTSPSTATGFRILMKSGYGTTYHNDIAINYPSTVTTYSPYANICPISGWTGANVTRAGKNILDMTVGSWSSGIIAADGTITPNGAYHYMTDSRPIKGGTDYAFGVTKDTSSAVGFAVSFYDEDDNFISTNVVVPAATTTGRRTATFTTPSGTARYRLRCPVESPQITSYQIEEGSTATDYEAYQADTILLDFGQTVYAGTLTALGGGLWKIQPTHAYRSITSADVFAKSANAQIQTGRAGYYLTTSNQWLATVQKSGGDGNPNGVSILSDVVYIGDTSAYDVIPATTFEVGIGVASGNTNLWFNVDATTCPDVASFKTYLDSLSMHICYPLATLPDPITITGEDLQTLLGANTVWTDCGSVTGMTYRADTALYIDKKLGA